MYPILYVITIILIFLFVRYYVNSKHPKLSNKKWTLKDLQETDMKTYTVIRNLLYFSILLSVALFLYIFINAMQNMIK